MKKLNKTKKIIIIFIILTNLVLLYDLSFFDKGIFKMKELLGNSKSFEELVLSNFKENKFNRGYMRRSLKEGEKVINEKKANELLDYFSKFEFIKYHDRHMSYGDISYDIHLHNDDTYESLNISLVESNTKLVDMTIRVIKVKKNEEKNVTKYSHENKYETYKIYNGEIDIKYIEEIYDSLYSRK